MMLKLKFIRNRVTLDTTNNNPETVIFDLREIIGILDLRLLGYYNIKQGVLQQNLSKYYHFESADIIFDYYNKFVNALKQEKEETKEKYPWLDKDNERKYITDREILEKYIDLHKSCLRTKKRKR